MRDMKKAEKKKQDPLRQVGTRTEDNGSSDFPSVCGADGLSDAVCSFKFYEG